MPQRINRHLDALGIARLGVLTLMKPIVLGHITSGFNVRELTAFRRCRVSFRCAQEYHVDQCDDGDSG